MKGINRWISEHPKTGIVIVLVVTAFMLLSIYSNGISTQMNEESFMPNTEVVNSYREITSNYTEKYTVQILVRSDNGNILNRESLAEIFEVEESLISNETVVSNLENPSYPEGNIISLPTTIAATRIAAEAFLQGINDTAISYYPYNMTQMRRALLGENITIPLENRTVNLSFIYTPSDVKQSIKLLSLDPNGKVALQYISRTLTKDFNISSQNMTADGCVIILSLNPQAENPLALEKTINDIVKGVDAQHVRMATLGNRLITDEIVKASNESMGILMPIAMLMIIIVLLIVFRNGMDALISLVALAFSIIWMYGFGAAFNFEFNPMTTAIPILLIGLGIDYGIHLTMRYREEGGDGKERVFKTLATVGAALLLATLTSMVAFLSNLVSPIKLLQQFGILSAFGIFAAFITMLFFVPAVQQLRRDKEKMESRITKHGKKLLGKIIGAGATAGNRNPLAVITIAIVITAVAGFTSLGLGTTFNTDEFLPKELEVTQDIHYLMNNFEFMGGEAQHSYILIKGDVASPSFFNEMNATISNMADDYGLVKVDNRIEVQTIATVMQQYSLSSGDETFSSLYNAYFDERGMPRNGTTRDNITMLYDYIFNANGKMVSSVLHKNGSYDASLIQISTNTAGDNEKTIKLYDELKDDVKPLGNFKVSVTGDEIANVMTEKTLNEGQTKSLMLTIISSFIILLVIFYLRDKSVMLGVITAIPIIFCVSWILGSMYLLGMSLNVMTITIASLTVGLGVTYGIHISHRFVEEMENGGDIGQAAHRTVNSTGVSLFGAAATTIAGFALLAFSLMPPLQQFGEITALTILFAFVSSVFILPSFLIVWARRKYGSD
jgi:uncharacterized protein